MVSSRNKILITTEVTEKTAKSRRFRFRLKWLFGLMTILCLAMGGFHFGLYPFLFKVIGLMIGVILTLFIFLLVFQWPLAYLLKNYWPQDQEKKNDCADQ